MKELKKMLQVEYEDFDPEYYGPKRELIDNLSICSIEKDVPELIKKNILPNNVSTGQVFMRSPYDDTKYIRLEVFEMTVMHDKADHIAEVARLLGATKCSVEITLTDMYEREGLFEGNGGKSGYVDVDVTVQNREQEKLRQSIKVLQEYTQAKVPTIEDYEQAERYAKEHHIYYDVKTLLAARSPMTKNLLTSKAVYVNLSSEANADLNVAVQLNALASVLKLGANYKRTMKYERQVVMSLIYEFAMPQ